MIISRPTDAFELLTHSDAKTPIPSIGEKHRRRWRILRQHVSVGTKKRRQMRQADAFGGLS